MKILSLLMVLWLGFSHLCHGAEVFRTDAFIREDVGMPMEIVLGRLVRDYYAFASPSYELQADKETFQQKEERYLSSLRRVQDYVLSEGLLQEVADYFNSTDEMNRYALRTLVHELVIMETHRIQAGASELLYGVNNVSELFRDVDSRVSYEYTLGKELKREVVKEFEAIHRHTLMENYEHNISIDIDFLEPLKKIINTLKLKDMFSWLWEQALHYSYHASFSHKKKIFTRSHGYYQNVAVTFEVLRRERYWWGGTGEWEKYGHTLRNVEEPRAVLTTEVKELD
jgi:hypothetical protein